MNLEFTKPQNLGSLLMKSSQSNFNLQLPSSYLARSYLIATVQIIKNFLTFIAKNAIQNIKSGVFENKPNFCELLWQTLDYFGGDL